MSALSRVLAVTMLVLVVVGGSAIDVVLLSLLLVLVLEFVLFVVVGVGRDGSCC